MTGEEIAIELTNHNDRLRVVEKGVSNFRKFQLDMTHKVGIVYGATWLAGIVGVVFLTVLGWALTQIVPAAKIVLDDYYRNHPTVQIQEKSLPNAPDPAHDQKSDPQKTGK
jgi:hypothetical protein